MAVAPTTSNSSIAGGVSAGIEPIAANVYAFKSAKGTFLRKNPVLEKLLEERGINTMETWKSINAEGGSVLHLKQLTEAEKQVFLTAREISQFAIVRQAAQRQQFIDQGQSVNLFFGINSDPKYVHEVHLEAWRLGLKGLYYCRAESILRGDFAARQVAECKSCEG
jgi:ribonucleoside-diphosphate reductase alpha chain